MWVNLFAPTVVLRTGCDISSSQLMKWLEWSGDLLIIVQLVNDNIRI